MTTQNYGGVAFPTGNFEYDRQNNVLPYQEPGITLRQYAAIKLRIPDSGSDWLDAMIKKSLRDGFAGQAMQGLLSESSVRASKEEFATVAYAMADAMLKAREAQ